MSAVIESKLCRFIVEDLEWEGTASELVGDSPVELPEILDSEELLEMVTFIEDEFAIEVDDEEIEPGSFQTVSDVARLIEMKVRAEESA